MGGRIEGIFGSEGGASGYGKGGRLWSVES